MSTQEDEIRIGFALAMVRMSRRWRWKLDQRLRSTGLTQARWTALLQIARGGDGMQQTQLADHIGIEGPTLVRLLNSLEAADLIQRRADPRDRRAKTVHLTERAIPVLAEIETLRPALEEGLSRASLQPLMRPGAARNALDCALWDLYGKLTGEPVWRLLGAGSGRVRCYASSGSLRSAEELAELAQRFQAEGFPAMKVRFQRPHWRDDIRALEGMRRAVGDEVLIMVDCNQGWRMQWDQAVPWTFKDALTVARELERLGVYWMEEPLHRGDYAGMRALRQATSVRIAGGELTKELYELRELVATGCLDVLQPDAICAGGITGLRKIAILAREHNLDFTPHTWGDGLGLVANAHLAAASQTKYLEFPYDPPNWLPAVRDFPFVRPVGVDAEGWLDLGEAPGMGMELDEERLAKTRVG